jgi:serine/threonine-protein kinase
MSQRRVIGERFEIQGLIGQGGMGSVFKGIDLASGEPVAIKVLKREVIASDPEQVERFQREAQVLYQLNHPNIVRIWDAIFQDGDYYIVMEYMPGGSLRDVLKREKRLPISDTLNLALDLSDALTRAHRLRIIHRDVKPDNVLLNANGVPHLTDFGEARITDMVALTRAGQIIGTPHYMAPEILMGQPANPSTDIWALGIMLYEMISGYRPFMGENFNELVTAILKQPIPHLRKLRGDCPALLAQLVHSTLERDPAARISSVREVGLYLEQVLNSLETGANYG